MQTPSANTPGLALLGVASGLGQLRPGLELGPDALRSTGILKEFSHLGWRPADLGDVAPGVTDDGAWGVIERVNVLSYIAMRQYGRMLLLGGDHSVSVGSIRAALSTHPDLKVIWVDAHGDMNTPETSPTGNLHGMPLACLLGLFRKQDRHPVLLPENLCLVGVRALDPAEADLIARTGIQVATAAQVQEKGVAKVLTDLGVLGGRQPIHLSFDIDALDPSEASATGIHVEGGLLASEALSLCSLIAKSGALVSMDMVEVNPLLAVDKNELQRTLKIAHDMIVAAWSPAPLAEQFIGAAVV